MVVMNISASVPNLRQMVGLCWQVDDDDDDDDDDGGGGDGVNTFVQS
jgi:hypothetical protein